MPFFGVPIRNGLPIGLGSVAGFGVQQFDPSLLFEGGTVPGAWYDPSDLSTMFTTSAGTTPVAMPGQGAAVPVGLMLDKSQGLVLGSELVTNGGPFVNTTGWLTTSATPLSVSSGILTGSTATATDALIYGAWLGNPGVLAANKYFEIKTTITALTGRVRFKIYGSNEVGPWITAPGTYTIRLYQTNANGNVGLNTDQATTVSILFFSVKQVSGNHAISFNNTTARPELRARVNLLTYSEDWTNAVWEKLQSNTGVAPVVTNNFAAAPDGTQTAIRVQFNLGATPATAVSRLYQNANDGVTTRRTKTIWAKTNDNSTKTIYFQGPQSANTLLTVTSTWTLFTISDASPAVGAFAQMQFGLDGTQSTSTTADILFWHPDIRQSNIGANVPAYQRIADANTYDTSGFPLYLRFDGIDDSMYTPANLNLSGTDKVAVFAGVRKLSDATQIINELSAVVDTNDGAYALGSITGSSNYFSALRGTALAYYTETTYAAPISNVHTTSYDIAGAATAQEIIPRVNGLTPTLAATGANAGTGNFGTYPLFIGSRNNSSLWFNGHLYSLVVAGSAVSAGNISATEQWVAGKTGIQI